MRMVSLRLIKNKSEATKLLLFALGVRYVGIVCLNRDLHRTVIVYMCNNHVTRDVFDAYHRDRNMGLCKQLSNGVK